MSYTVNSLSGVPLQGFEVASPSQPEIPEVQESTMQVPCGAFSIFDPDMLMPEFCRAVYLVINEHSHWDSGISHALSNRAIADKLGVKYASQVNRAIHWLIANGWLEVAGERSDGTFFYRVIHHKCPPDKVPLDKQSRPQKCAVPRGAGSGSALCAEGKLDWRAMVSWFVKKVYSDWITGFVAMTVRETRKLVRFSFQTICDNARKLTEVGLLKRLSSKFRASEFQLFPGPYPDRRERSEYKGKKPLALIGDWYYSHNKRWRFHKDTLRLMMEEVDGRWRDTGMSELLELNPKIHVDFKVYMDIYASQAFSDFRQSLQQVLGSS